VTTLRLVSHRWLCSLRGDRHVAVWITGILVVYFLLIFYLILIDLDQKVNQGHCQYI